MATMLKLPFALVFFVGVFLHGLRRVQLHSCFDIVSVLKEGKQIIQLLSGIISTPVTISTSVTNKYPTPAKLLC